MKGDFTRFTFNPKKRYRGVLQQQGRVQLDADWNEQHQIAGYRSETTVSDVIGPTGGPLSAAGFQITVTPDKKDLRIGAGRYYVNGILCESDTAAAPNAQEDLPAAAKIMTTSAGAIAYSSAPEAGIYLAYLDVWLHHLTALERPDIRESALGGPDHATREKVMAHVKFVRVASAGTNTNCLGSFTTFTTITSPYSGRIKARTRPGGNTADNVCIVDPGAGYRRLENQLYRIEIHDPGTFNGSNLPTNPTFKWSRDNGSITARWDAQSGNDLTVSTPGRDSVTGFASGQWVELTDDNHEATSEAGLLVQITSVKGNVITVNPNGQTVNRALFPNNPKIRRWDSPGAVRVRHNTSAGSDGYLTLDGEGGIEIDFAPGSYRSGDYWLIPARTSGPTSIGDIEWPRDNSGPVAQEPAGIHHCYARLALVEFNAGEWKLISDCRRLFSPLVEQTALFMLGGDGQEILPLPTQSLIPLNEPLRVGVSCGSAPAANMRVRFTVTKGQGRVEGAASITKATDATGVVTCAWSVDNTTVDQQVTATLLDAADHPVHLPVTFTATLELAAGVSFDPTHAPDLAGKLTVQAAIEALAIMQQASGGAAPDIYFVNDVGYDQPLHDGDTISMTTLARGLRLKLPAPVNGGSANDAVVSLSAEVPVLANALFPSRQISDPLVVPGGSVDIPRTDLQPEMLIGYQPLVMAATVGTNNQGDITWKPTTETTIGFKHLLTRSFRNVDTEGLNTSFDVMPDLSGNGDWRATGAGVVLQLDDIPGNGRSVAIHRQPVSANLNTLRTSVRPHVHTGYVDMGLVFNYVSETEYYFIAPTFDQNSGSLVIYHGHPNSYTTYTKSFPGRKLSHMAMALKQSVAVSSWGEPAYWLSFSYVLAFADRTDFRENPTFGLPSRVVPGTRVGITSRYAAQYEHLDLVYPMTTLNLIPLSPPRMLVRISLKRALLKQSFGAMPFEGWFWLMPDADRLGYDEYYGEYAPWFSGVGSSLL